MKPFDEALRDGFSHITNITDPVLLATLRGEGIRVDDEGIHSYTFGDHHEFELRLEPMPEEGQYAVALYKNNILLIPKLLLWSTQIKPT